MAEIFGGKCTVKYNEILGRYLVANKDFTPGETILKEEPAIISPLWNSKPRCSNCYRETFAVCRNCNVFPLCLHCASHNNIECAFMQNQDLPTNFLVDNFGIFAPLKALLYMENEAIENSSILLEMECHSDKRRHQDIWKLHEENIVIPLLEHFKGVFKRIHLDDTIIQKLCGIFDVNAFEIRGPDNFDVLRGLYPQAALLSHSCVANTLISVDDTYHMKVYATEAIKKDDVIYYNYTNPLLGTAERRKQLLLGKYFTCSCPRCLDRTELDTHMSSITCQRCKSLITPPKDIVWNCNSCNLAIPGTEVEQILSRISTEIREAAGDLCLMEMLIKRYSTILNPSHYLIVDLKQNVASIIRDICINAPDKPGKNVLERKIQLCDDILPVLKSIQRGISRLVGIALYEKFCPLFKLVRMQYETDEIDDQHYLDRLHTAEATLKTAIQMLLYEQVQSAEGRLMKNALRELGDLRKTITFIHNMIQNKLGMLNE